MTSEDNNNNNNNNNSSSNIIMDSKPAIITTSLQKYRTMASDLHSRIAVTAEHVNVKKEALRHSQNIISQLRLERSLLIYKLEKFLSSIGPNVDVDNVFMDHSDGNSNEKHCNKFDDYAFIKGEDTLKTEQDVVYVNSGHQYTFSNNITVKKKRTPKKTPAATSPANAMKGPPPSLAKDNRNDFVSIPVMPQSSMLSFLNGIDRTKYAPLSIDLVTNILLSAFPEKNKFRMPKDAFTLFVVASLLMDHTLKSYSSVESATIIHKNWKESHESVKAPYLRLWFDIRVLAQAHVVSHAQTSPTLPKMAFSNTGPTATTFSGQEKDGNGDGDGFGMPAMPHLPESLVSLAPSYMNSMPQRPNNGAKRSLLDAGTGPGGPKKSKLANTVDFSNQI